MNDDTSLTDPNIEDMAVQPIYKSRGDSFDIGSLLPKELVHKEPEIINVLQNPAQLALLLDITEEQANNLRALVIGGGAGLSAKYLSKYFGSAVSGALGGFVAGLIAEKMFKKGR